MSYTNVDKFKLFNLILFNLLNFIYLTQFKL